MTVLFGIAATPDVALDGNILLARSIDVAQRPQLFVEHKRAVGQVLHLQWIGNNLHITAETDDADALRLNHFSVAGRPIERTQRADGRWDVSRFRVTEISLVREPVNINCVVRERNASHPLIELHKIRLRNIDLFKQAFGTISRSLQEVARHVG